MSLRDLGLESKGVYDSAKEDVLDSFYIPALSRAVTYKRVSGFFSSSSLAVAAKGMAEFIKNGGRMQLITSVKLSEVDAETIARAISEAEKSIITEIDCSEDELKKDHLKMLGWMVRSGRLEIRIAVPGGNKGIEHQKYGILEDSSGNMIEFFGSDNETASGWLFNHEKFHVYLGWVESDKERHLKHDLEDFEELWNDLTGNMRVYPISDAFKKQLIQRSPKTEEEFNTLSEYCLRRAKDEYKGRYSFRREQKEPSRRELREYQEEAIRNWSKNFKGILKMATGTGKTFTALRAIDAFLKRYPKSLVVIVAPTQLLVSQWIENLEAEGFKNIIPVMQNKSVWAADLKTGILKLRLGRAENLFAVATYDSFCSKDLIDFVNKTEETKLLVCDEVHHAWAPETRKGMLPEFIGRLGLSATPEIYMDPEGTQELLDYFEGICFEFSMKQAIPEFLTEYEYYAEIAILTDEEREKYESLSTRIARAIHANKGKVDDKIFMMILERSRILVNAEAKWAAFEKILSSIPDIKRTLIYCSDKQIERVKEILHDKKIRAHQITHEESLEYRQEIIRLFQEDKYQAVIAMKVLDEGIDVPGIERAIILASSGNPVEFIQRRGRILRRSPGKEFSIIHDVLVFPWERIPLKISESERSALRRELLRVDEFLQSARNPLTVKNNLTKYQALLSVPQ